MTTHKENCRNCGAPVKGCECQYCGTEYDNNDYIQVPYEAGYKVMMPSYVIKGSGIKKLVLK